MFLFSFISSLSLVWNRSVSVVCRACSSYLLIFLVRLYVFQVIVAAAVWFFFPIFLFVAFQFHFRVVMRLFIQKLFSSYIVFSFYYCIMCYLIICIQYAWITVNLYINLVAFLASFFLRLYRFFPILLGIYLYFCKQYAIIYSQYTWTQEHMHIYVSCNNNIEPNNFDCSVFTEWVKNLMQINEWKCVRNEEDKREKTIFTNKKGEQQQQQNKIISLR